MTDPEIPDSTLAAFGLKDADVVTADKAHKAEERLFNTLCVSWFFLCIVAFALWGAAHSTRHFGWVQWAALGFFVGAGSQFIVAGLIVPWLVRHISPYRNIYEPVFARHHAYTEATKKHEEALEHERVRLWREEQARKKLSEDFWWQMDGHTVEREIGAIYRTLGYSVTVTRASGDGGVDIILEQDGRRYAVQCKAHRDSIGPSTLRDLFGTMHAGHFDGAILVAFGGVSAIALDFASQHGITILTLSDIIAMQTKISHATNAA